MRCRTTPCRAVLGFLAILFFAATTFAPTEPPSNGLNFLVYPTLLYQKIQSHELYDPDEFSVPLIKKRDGAILLRTDPQIARSGVDEPAFTWTGTAALVWNGYIRFPAAGTYYLATASERASAVYVNGARVALNGQWGGTIPSEQFEYPSDHGAKAPYNPANAQYSLPITVTRPRVFPIEIRFFRYDSHSHITLYWANPDSARGPGGKPLLSVVPTKVLFPAIPEQHRDEIETPIVSAAQCTISCDRLYFFEGVPDATVKVRLADLSGRGVPGKKVVLFQSSSRTQAVLEQPTTLTDQNGETVAKLKPAYDIGALRLYAFDLTDVVQVPQVCHTLSSSPEKYSYLPYGESPYYDRGGFKAEPLPMKVGEPVTITIPLHNRKNSASSVYVTAAAAMPNIGTTDWEQLGKSEKMTLAPAETREVKITFTPDKPHGHVCFKLIVWETRAAKAAVPIEHGLFSTRLGASVLLTQAAPPNIDTPVESRQQNIGPVEPHDCKPDRIKACRIIDAGLRLAAETESGLRSTFRTEMAEIIRQLSKVLCDKPARIKMLQMNDRLATLNDSLSGQQKRMVAAAMEIGLEDLRATTCRAFPPACLGTEGEPGHRSEQDNLLIEAVKKALGLAVDEGFAGRPAQQGRNIQKKVNEIKGYLDQIRSAACLPGKLRQATEGYISRDRDQAACNEMAKALADWVVELSGDERLRPPIVQAIMAHCTQREAGR